MNNVQYREFKMKVPNWKRLSFQMIARYDQWKQSSDCTWTTKYIVTVTHSNGRKLKNAIAYPFELKSSVDQCVQWWQENGCLIILEEVA